MSEDGIIQVSRTVDVAPEPLFAVLADPARHLELDASSMLRGIAEGERVRAVGDAFVMDMHNDRLGDYQMLNTVVAFEEGRVIAWAPSLHPIDSHPEINQGMVARGHVYRWELAPTADGGSTVTQTYDWTGVEDPRFRARFPRLSAETLEASIERLAEVAR